MGAKVSFKIASTIGNEGERFNASGDKETWYPTYKEGQIIFVEDLGKIYLDFHDKRTCYTPNSLSYIGISKYNPTDSDEDGKITLIDNTIVTPKINDMVVWKKKEYMWRKGEDGNRRWFEVGDEDAPEWN